MLVTSSSQEVLSNLEFTKIWVCWFSLEEQTKILPKEPSLKIWFRTVFPSRVLSEPLASGDLAQLTTSPIENIRMSFIPSSLSISIGQIVIHAEELIGKTTQSPTTLDWIQISFLKRPRESSDYIVAWRYLYRRGSTGLSSMNSIRTTLTDSPESLFIRVLMNRSGRELRLPR